MKKGSLKPFISPDCWANCKSDAVQAGVLDGFPITDVSAVLTRSACVYDQLSLFRLHLSPSRFPPDYINVAQGNCERK